MNKKNVLVLMLLLLTLPAAAAFADETDVTTQGNVGFTGKWESPPSSQEPSAATGDRAALEPPPASHLPVTVVDGTGTTAINLPATGEAEQSPVLTTLLGVMLVILVMGGVQSQRSRQ
ncbi:hypothetical protein [Pseudolactococcus reticulitermitis]|uniref:Gram-positive cocci surface proteins LPxTG domain-containing protein n=1 Tax=Pseudolactococcus reticulitermitis TaxID=2025039 RepID=A0A224X1G4_9LACT|nr:hypothetical protein [Lactococcus reticulitermitis]GAX48028.1 hypothetical protein RsY01_1642 [Lactococcus reticulitermitis]